MYHDVDPVPPTRAGGASRFTVSAESFELMLDTIHAEGLEGCSLTEARVEPDASKVAITFDDGTRGQLDHAVPALSRRGMAATFFVVTDWVGRPGFMTWDELRRIRDLGMSVQSHTKSHRHLSELDEGALRSELEESRWALDEALQQQTTELALPGGNAPRLRLRHLLADCGYLAVSNSRWGSNSDRGDATGGFRWVRRCNVPHDLDATLARRILRSDRRLIARHYPREALLNGVRSFLGADRYARWRRRVLDTLARS
ncbi:MAG: polysaccharide deacetylase family protein [Gemmatimonadota bacterium]|nr:polysaccharide deacetylase family protein [Gemmatimonadota bacterium]